MKKLVTLVEGEGDFDAVPVLLRKLFKRLGRFDWQPGDVVRVGELPKLRKNLERQVGALRVRMAQGTCHGALVLLDLDRGCPLHEATRLAAELASYGLPYPVAVVFAHREYEEWFVSSLDSIVPNFPTVFPNGARRDYPLESKPGVKEWLTRQMPLGKIYKETVQQRQFTEHLDPERARECRSFRRLLHALEELLTGAEEAEPTRRGMATP